MSHFVTIKTQIKDLDALRSALKKLGLSLFPNAQARGYEENNIKGDYVIRLNGPYDVALNKQGARHQDGPVSSRNWMKGVSQVLAGRIGVKKRIKLASFCRCISGGGCHTLLLINLNNQFDGEQRRPYQIDGK
jgi:hypothetical protein